MYRQPVGKKIGQYAILAVWIIAVLAVWGLPKLIRAGSRTPGAPVSGAVYLPGVWVNFPYAPGILDYVVISEVMYDPEESENEWIEIFNPSDETVDLSAYKVGDEETLGEQEGMLQFPPGAWMSPGQVIVVAKDATLFRAAYGFDPHFEMADSGSPVPDMVKYTAWTGGNVNLTNSGDEVILLDLTDTLVDAVSWGSSVWAFDPAAPNTGKGNSLERSTAYIDAGNAGDWRTQADPNPGQVPLIRPTPIPSPTPEPSPTLTPTVGPTATPFAGRMLISEVMYDPQGDEPHEEWIEIYNPESVPVPLHNFKIGDEETQGEGEAMYRFPVDLSIQPGGTVVIANRAADFIAVYGFAPHAEFVDSNPDVPDMVKYTGWSNGSPSLGNSGDEVLLLDTADNVLDALSWGDSAWAFDPPAPDVGWDTDSAVDWHEQPDPDPGNVDPRTPTPTPTPFTGAFLISEVLFNPDGSDDGQEWIELYNATGGSVNLTGFKVGDDQDPLDGSSEGMLAFPNGATIEPGGVIVIAANALNFEARYGFEPDFEMEDSGSPVPEMTPYPGWSSGSVTLTNSGDELLLIDPGDNLVDAVSWGSSDWAFDPPVDGGEAQGNSIERQPADQDTNSAADWRDQPAPDPGNVNNAPPTATPTVTGTPTRTPTPTFSPTPGPTATPTATSTPFGQPLLISEVVYDAASEPEGEWIELHNASGMTIDLSNFKLGDEETQGGVEGMFQFPAGAVITSGQTIVIANQATTFSATYGLNPDYELVDSDPSVPDMAVYAAWAGPSLALGNSGDEVLLLDSGDRVIDAVSWGNSAWAFDPPGPGVPEGHSLERFPADQDTDSAADWRDQSSPTPGQLPDP